TGVGRYRNVGEAICRWRSGSDREDDSAAPCGERRGRGWSHSVSLLAARQAYDGRDSQRDRRLRLVRMTFPEKPPIPSEVPPIRHEWRDPFQGEQDLEKKLIRSVGDPNWRFQEDYLRILRALRFSARFEFRIHARTLEAAKANAQGLAQLSAERVRDEWFKGLMTAARVSKLLTLWMEVGAARIWLPEIREKGEGRGSISAVDNLPRDPDLIAAGVRPGPDVGETLQRLLAEVLEDPSRNTKPYLLSRV